MSEQQSEQQQQQSEYPPSPAYVFRSHGWLISFDGQDWQASNDRQQRVHGAAEVLYAVAITAAWKRRHGIR